MDAGNYLSESEREARVAAGEYDGDSSDSDEDEEQFDDDPYGSEVSYSSGRNARGESVAIPDRSRHPDGTRTWRYQPSALPSDWPEDWVDENIEQVMTLGWIEPNEPGNSWTTAEATAANAAYVEQATANYRPDPSFYDPAFAVDASAYDFTAAGDDAPAGPPAPPQAPPPPPAPDAAGTWQRPDDPNAATGGTSYGNVLDELRRTVPENDGRWTASQAAGVYGDQEYFEQDGIRQATDRAGAAPRPDDEGRINAADYVAMAEAGADVGRAYNDAERNDTRYNQTTGRDLSQYDEQDGMLDEGMAGLRNEVQADPGAFGIGLTYDEQDYAARSGQTVQPGVGLSDEQRQWLEQVRANDLAEDQRRSDEFAASPEGQRQSAEAQAAYERETARQQRVEESRQAYTERTGNR